MSPGTYSVQTPLEANKIMQSYMVLRYRNLSTYDKSMVGHPPSLNPGYVAVSLILTLKNIFHEMFLTDFGYFLWNIPWEIPKIFMKCSVERVRIVIFFHQNLSEIFRESFMECFIESSRHFRNISWNISTKWESGVYQYSRKISWKISESVRGTFHGRFPKCLDKKRKYSIKRFHKRFRNHFWNIIAWNIAEIFVRYPSVILY